MVACRPQNLLSPYFNLFSVFILVTLNASLDHRPASMTHQIGPQAFRAYSSVTFVLLNLNRKSYGHPRGTIGALTIHEAHRI